MGIQRIRALQYSCTLEVKPTIALRSGDGQDLTADSRVRDIATLGGCRSNRRVVTHCDVSAQPPLWEVKNRDPTICRSARFCSECLTNDQTRIQERHSWSANFTAPRLPSSASSGRSQLRLESFWVLTARVADFVPVRLRVNPDMMRHSEPYHPSEHPSRHEHARFIICAWQC